ncbi:MULTISPECIES: hypothetical protein [unclassified Brevibacterium]|uniref:hypothetical protein n=1 Tax=unclassified Brevibacterium TaxID=2614124 RepID=UPI001092C16E|nr:hypothetical protein [Brevibacterium sp. S22]TGD29728.1 hypothetical protein EB835_15830 [Brevibacterium sp. S22]
MSTEDNTDGTTADSMRKAAENLDHEAGGAPSAEYLKKVDPDEFGRSDETAEDENDDDEDTDDEDVPPAAPSTDR